MTPSSVKGLLQARFLNRLKREGLLAEYQRISRLEDIDARARTYVAQMRATAKAEGAAFSVADRLTVEALVGASRQEGGPPLQGLVDAISSQVEKFLQDSDLVPSHPVLVVQYPTGSFNAQCCAVPGGFLVLINSGLFMLLYQTAKILSLAFRFTDYDSAGRLVPDRRLGVSTFTVEEISKEFGAVILAYLFRGDPTFAPQLPVQGGPRALIMEMIVSNSELFAVGHEYGHIVSGHLSSPEGLQIVAIPDDSEAPLVWRAKRQEEELDADQFGAALLIRSFELVNESDPLAPLEAACLATGPSFFFALDRLITRVRDEVDEVPNELVVTDHPPPDVRASRVADWFAGRFGERFLDIAIACEEWVAGQEDAVVVSAKRLLLQTRNLKS